MVRAAPGEACGSVAAVTLVYFCGAGDGTGAPCMRGERTTTEPLPSHTGVFCGFPTNTERTSVSKQKSEPELLMGNHYFIKKTKNKRAGTLAYKITARLGGTWASCRGPRLLTGAPN